MELEIPQLVEMKQETNKEFYSNCTTYFASLRQQGRTDDSFEDEFYFTMPAVSGTE